jgi:hypothetical protein
MSNIMFVKEKHEGTNHKEILKITLNNTKLWCHIRSEFDYIPFSGSTCCDCLQVQLLPMQVRHFRYLYASIL